MDDHQFVEMTSFIMLLMNGRRKPFLKIKCKKKKEEEGQISFSSKKFQSFFIIKSRYSLKNCEELDSMTQLRENTPKHSNLSTKFKHTDGESKQGRKQILCIKIENIERKLQISKL